MMASLMTTRKRRKDRYGLNPNEFDFASLPRPLSNYEIKNEIKNDISVISCSIFYSIL